MIAVVDGQTESRLEVGAAAPPRLPSGLVDHNAVAGRRQTHGCRQAGQAGADDMNGSVCAQKKPYRKMGQRICERVGRTEVRGAAQPRSTSLSRIVW